MASDYILFVHGVNVRSINYADPLFRLMQTTVSPGINLKSVQLYWGDVNQDDLFSLTRQLKASPAWSKLWFQEFRQTQLLQFAGDAALYISRLVGTEAVMQIKEQALKGLSDYKRGEDRLHLVTHSWGTVILFDVLFAGRWLELDKDDPGRQAVEAIRSAIYGLSPRPEQGYRLASIHTMGSPIALFSLITLSGKDSGGTSTHDLAPGLDQLLANICGKGNRLPWRNFMHPGDPVAWPLEGVIKDLVDENCIDIQDELTKGSGPLDLLARPLKNTYVALLNGGNAHGSYWQNREVAQLIGQTIEGSSKRNSHS